MSPMPPAVAAGFGRLGILTGPACAGQRAQLARAWHIVCSVRRQLLKVIERGRVANVDFTWRDTLRSNRRKTRHHRALQVHALGRCSAGLRNVRTGIHALGCAETAIRHDRAIRRRRRCVVTAGTFRPLLTRDSCGRRPLDQNGISSSSNASAGAGTLRAGPGCGPRAGPRSRRSPPPLAPPSPPIPPPRPPSICISSAMMSVL